MLRSSAFRAVEYVVGSRKRSYEELEQLFGTEAMKKVYAGSGIRSRQIAPPEMCGSDLAFAAAEKIFERYPDARGSIDLLIHCTQSPDHFMPATACLLQHRLGLSKQCAAFDINLGCSQYVYG